MPNDKVVENLNKALAMELTAAHQYQLHAHVLDDWGLGKLALKMREEMTEELGHADAFIARLMFLKGDPELALDKAPHRAGDLLEMFRTDLSDEEEAIDFYTKAASHAAEVGDIGSRTLFEKTVLDEEGHKAWLELQIELISRVGEMAYSANFMDIGNEEA
jgi:bacterioferritin